MPESEPEMTRYSRVWDKQGREHITNFADSFSDERVQAWAEREFIAVHHV